LIYIFKKNVLNLETWIMGFLSLSMHR